MRNKAVVPGIVALLAILFLPVFRASAASSTSLNSRLTAIINAVLVAQNDVLVGGNVDAKYQARANVLDASFQAEYRVRLQSDQDRRINVALHKITYTGYHMDLSVSSVNATALNATALATEHTVIDMAGDSDPQAPKSWEYLQKHLFTFVVKNGQWILSDDKLLDAPDVSGARPDLPSPGALTSAIPPRVTALVGRAYRMRLAAMRLASPVNINRSAVYNYAFTYWSNHNPAYRDFSQSGGGGDCTNFVSQALRAGGWPDQDKQLGYYWSDTEWWYDPAFGQTYSWINASHFYTFTGYSGRAQAVWGLQLGDIIQADWSGRGTAYIDHSMIVTASTPVGYYMTYHTTDTWNRPFSDIQAAYPGALYYPWHMYG